LFAIQPRCYEDYSLLQEATKFPALLLHSVQTPAFKKYPSKHVTALGNVQDEAPDGQATQ